MKKIWILVGFLYLANLALSGSPSTRPNIVLLLTDDQHPDTIRALGNEAIITPTLDRLTEEGMSFMNAYNQGSFTPAVCLASRAMIVTGQNWERLAYQDRTATGVFEGREVKRSLAFPSTPVLGDLLNDAGYFTGALIKVGPSPKAMEGRFTYTRQISPDEDRLGGFSGRNAVNMALEFLQAYDESEAKQQENPYFLYIGFPGPHDPRFADQSLLERYEEWPPLPTNYAPFYPYANGFQLMGRDEVLVPHPRTEEMARVERLYHYAMVTSIDEQIGRLVEKLKERGEYENTLIIFTSDNGLSLGAHGLFGKQSLYEEAVKVPFVVAGPGIPAGRRSDTFLYLHDLYATICEAAGIPVPDDVHAKSLFPVLRGEQAEHRDAVYLPMFANFRSLRQGDWKLMKFMNIEQPSLYNLKDDPYEMEDLADHPEHAARIQTMLAALKQAMKDHGSDVQWPKKYKQKTLTPLSRERVIELRKAYDEGHGGLQKTAQQTEDARKAGTGLGVWYE